ETYTAPKLVDSVRPDPVYYSMHREIEGYVTLELLVNEEGEVDQAKVKYTTSDLAVKNALEAVSQWTFEPATVSGTPMKSWVAYNLPFGSALSIYEDAKYARKVIVEDVTYALAQK
ncbi:TonB family protein, partial [bacterium]|nr:TonB family protein [bacterium]